LQEREVQRVGANQPIRCNVRVIAAANRDLAQAVAQGKFREDLYYRLNVFPIYLPPLRNRIDDIPALVTFFAKKLSADLNLPQPVVSTAAMKILQTYHYPGNIRELQNIIERAMLLAGPAGGNAEIQPHHLPKEILHNVGEIVAADKISSPPSTSAAPRERLYESPPKISILAEQEKNLILRALDESGWNQAAAARELGISRDNLRYRLKKYAISRGDS
ncbi:MAG: sigma 54-interacting transcriptional regulator, partial [Candidatus Izemoplasmatales bacterium]|nr:sigma 54-interacting transcriptional regulator [Candidatus Izemoplasmatales bacterium]